MSKLETLRWVLFIPAGIGGFYLALIIMISVQAFLDANCPAEYVVVGDAEYCVYPAWVNTALTAAGGAMAAFFVVFLGSLVAPGLKRHVPYLLFIGGAVFAAYFIVNLRETVAGVFVVGVSTLGVGVVTAIWLSRKVSV